MKEGTVKKGGQNEKPTIPPPSEPPKGQDGYQPNKGNLNPNDPSRGGCGIPQPTINVKIKVEINNKNENA